MTEEIPHLSRFQCAQVFDCSQENESYNIVVYYIVIRNPVSVTFHYLSCHEFDLGIASNLTGKEKYELFETNNSTFSVYIHAVE